MELTLALPLWKLAIVYYSLLKYTLENLQQKTLLH